MGFSLTTRDDSIIISTPSRFDFRLMQDFDKATGEAVAGGGMEIVVDLSGTAYMDSSALAMLLVLRDRARSKGKTVVLSQPGVAARGVLDIANFDKVFSFR